MANMSYSTTKPKNSCITTTWSPEETRKVINKHHTVHSTAETLRPSRPAVVSCMSEKAKKKLDDKFTHPTNPALSDFPFI